MRPTAEEALNHPLFAKIRNQEKEPKAGRSVKLSIDQIQPGTKRTKDMLRCHIIELYIKFQNRIKF